MVEKGEKAYLQTKIQTISEAVAHCELQTVSQTSSISAASWKTLSKLLHFFLSLSHLRTRPSCQIYVLASIMHKCLSCCPMLCACFDSPIFSGAEYAWHTIGIEIFSIKSLIVRPQRLSGVPAIQLEKFGNSGRKQKAEVARMLSRLLRCTVSVQSLC